MIDLIFKYIHTFAKWLHEHSKANSIYFIQEHRQQFYEKDDNNYQLKQGKKQTNE